MNFLAYAFVVVAGALTTVQSGSNAQLVRSLGRPWLVALIVSLLTAIVFAGVFFVTGAKLPDTGRLAGVPWWAWFGGFCGAASVISTLFFAEKMGAGPFTALTITAGIIASIAIDHFGLIGFQQHSASLLRLAGATLMIAGLLLVAMF